MSRKRLTAISSARGKYVRQPPLFADPRLWLESHLDWSSTVTVVDVFSGIGGLSFGFDSVPGMRVVAAFEQDRIACETHAANMPSPVVQADVAQVESFPQLLSELGVKRVDVLAGGPPCQGFSRLGKGALRKIALGNGLADHLDPRNYLFRHFLRAVRQVRPQVVVIENVPDMLSYGAIIEEMCAIFGDLGYRLEPRILEAHDFGVPQQRKRLFMVANRHGDTMNWPTPCPDVVTLWKAIGDLPPVPPEQLQEGLPWLSPAHPGAYLREMRAGLVAEEANTIRDHITRAHRPEDIVAFSCMEQGDKYRSVPAHLRRYRDDIFADKYHRMVWSQPAWTVTAHIAKDGYKYIHPEQNRTISVREAARIQSFPDRFRFAGFRTNRFKHIGNAVPPKLAAALGASIVTMIR